MSTDSATTETSPREQLRSNLRWVLNELRMITPIDGEIADTSSDLRVLVQHLSKKKLAQLDRWLCKARRRQQKKLAKFAKE